MGGILLGSHGSQGEWRGSVIAMGEYGKIENTTDSYWGHQVNVTTKILKHPHKVKYSFNLCSLFCLFVCCCCFFVCLFVCLW